MKETPKYQEPFKVTIDGKQAFFASNVMIASAIDDDITKDMDCISVRDKASAGEYNPWPTSFTFETTMDPSPSFRRFVNRMLGRVRPNRGISRTKEQRYIRTAHYLVKTKRMLFVKPQYILADYRKFNPNKPPF